MLNLGLSQLSLSKTSKSKLNLLCDIKYTPRTEVLLGPVEGLRDRVTLMHNSGLAKNIGSDNVRHSGPDTRLSHQKRGLSFWNIDLKNKQLSQSLSVCKLGCKREGVRQVTPWSGTVFPEIQNYKLTKINELAKFHWDKREMIKNYRRQWPWSINLATTSTTKQHSQRMREW